TVNTFGKGKCYYIGCDLNEDGTEALLNHILQECGVSPALKNMPKGVEVVKKTTEKGEDFYYMVNFSKEKQKVELPFEAMDIAAGTKIGKTVELAAYDCAVFKKA
ncbi:MAG: Beta-galactosidase C-terminal domain, partial [Oscillospiraceae bacterium]